MNRRRFYNLISRLSYARLGRYLIHLLCGPLCFALPVSRLRETKTLLAFHHPEPDYPFHVLLAPKKLIDSFTALNPGDTSFLIDLVTTVQGLVEEFKLVEGGYRVIVNGGGYQQFPRLHFHLVAGTPGQEYA